MRTAITLGFTHAAPAKAVIVSSTDIPVTSQYTTLKELQLKGVNAAFERMEIWENRGMSKRAYFDKPAPMNLTPVKPAHTEHANKKNDR